MKPSEKIEQRVAAYQKAIAEEAGSREFDPIGAGAVLVAILEYLDDQRELDRRRTYLHAALTALVPIGAVFAFDAEQFDYYAKMAGLKVRTSGRDYVVELRAQLLTEAEQEGIL